LKRQAIDALLLASLPNQATTALIGDFMNTDSVCSGCYTALVTPLDELLQIDYASFEAFIEWQIEQGVDGIVPCGTTGESVTLSPQEHGKLIETAVKTAAGRVHVMAGSGSNATNEAINYSQHAQRAGADSLLVVAPYYNKPSQDGIFAHYKAVADAVDLPVYVYNIPGRSVVNISDETLKKLADACPNIAGVKDATNDLARISTLRHLTGDRLNLLSGEDMTMVGYNAMGGNGVISVTSNIAPALVKRVQHLSLKGKFAEALKIHEKLVPLHQALFGEPSPAPVKYALSRMGVCRNNLRLPMVSASAKTEKTIDKLLNELELIGSYVLAHSA
jgi:4-hydroxy-tetrahydrodipicolinate synthase